MIYEVEKPLSLEKSTQRKILSTFQEFVSLLQISSDEDGDQDSEEVVKPTTKKSKKTKKSYRVIESGL